MSKMVFAMLFCIMLIHISCQQTKEDLMDRAYTLSKEKNYKQAIKLYTEIIQRNNKLQQPYYNRGFCYFALKDYPKALSDFNKIIDLHMMGNLVFTLNSNSPLADEEAKSQIPYNDAIYQRAQVKYFMDSIKSSFLDFQMLIDDNYPEKSNCILWQGTILVRSNNSDKACAYFEKAKLSAMNEDDKQEADKMIATYCLKKNGSH